MPTAEAIHRAAEDRPPGERRRHKKRDVLKDVDRLIVQRPLVVGRHVPDREGEVEGHERDQRPNACQVGTRLERQPDQYTRLPGPAIHSQYLLWLESP